MSHSTTATSTFMLRKYSRSYPNINGAEWQHYANPTIHLAVDARSTSSGELESVRLRIVWSMDNGEDVNVNQVIFEDLDLLSFAGPLRNTQRQSHGLPLKAVYRDTIVGIRYLHPKEYSTSPTYRRFQMTFASSAVAAQFINVIRPVCSCKLNGSPNDAPSIQDPQQTMPPPSVPFQMINESQLSMPIRTPQPTPSWPTQNNILRTQTMRPADSYTQQHPYQHDLTTFAQQQSSSMSSPALLRQDSFALHHPAYTPFARPSTTTSDAHTVPQVAMADAHVHMLTQQRVSGPMHSDPPLMKFSAAPVPAKVPLNDLTTSELYKLSAEELQSYAEEIIQEEGFLKLMTALSASWNLRQFIDVRIS